MTNSPHNNSENLEKDILELLTYCRKQNHLGYSLYDSHNSVIPFEKLGHKISFLTNQVVKRSPVNLRRILGVKKGINPKGMGLLLHSYCLILNNGEPEVEGLKESADEIFMWLYNNQSKGYSGTCWGYNYDWPRSDGSMFHAYTPSVVVTAFIARGLLEYYKLTSDQRVKELINSACDFVKNDIHCTKFESSRCYSYTPVQKDLVINASLLAAELFAYADWLNGEHQYEGDVQEVLNYTVANQNQDGSWYYSHSPDTGKPKKQIDFHQGYVVDSMDILCEIYGFQQKKYKEAINSGVNFYYKQQFDPKGFCYWRVPKTWPIDIHNQSQGIITFSRFKDQNPSLLPFAETIFLWTKNNMRSPNGWYYYQKYSWFTNKTNYFRWNQCWMLLAQIKLYLALKEQT